MADIQNRISESTTDDAMTTPKKKMKVNENNDDAAVPQQAPIGILPEIVENDLMEVLSNRNPSAVDARKRKAMGQSENIDRRMFLLD